MKITQEDLADLVSQGIISQAQADTIWLSLRENTKEKPKFDLPHVAYYFGTILVMLAMGWFMTEAWNRFGWIGLTVLATLYAVLFALAGKTLWYQEKHKVPGGLLFTLAVWMVPLIIFGIEKATGFWPQGDPGRYQNYFYLIKGSWILMEIGTILAGCLALKYIRFPFLTFPIAFSLWFLSMDLTPLLLGRMEFMWLERVYVSIVFGVVMLLGAYLIDRRTKEDYAFWGYLFGLIAFWGGLNMLVYQWSEGELFFYALLNLFLIMISILFQRKVFIVFGAFGLIGYLGHLAYEVFANSLLFPFVLVMLGVFIIYLGVEYQKKSVFIEEKIFRLLPESIKSLLPLVRN